MEPRTVLTIGTFDLLHHGHTAFLLACSHLGERIVVGVNSDDFVTTFKPPPVMTQDERMHAISLLGYDVLLNSSAGRELIERVRPQVLAIGSDWAVKNYYDQIGVSQVWLDSHGIILAYVPYTQFRHFAISSTEIKNRVLAAGK